MSDGTHATAEATRRLLAGLIAAALVQDDDAAKAARREALAAHAELLSASGGAPPPELKLDGLWVQAIGLAEKPALLRMGLEVSPSLPKACPIAVADLFQPGLALSELEEQIRASASTG